MSLKRENIEAIIPLLPNQQAFLWVRSQSAHDPGRLQVTCRLHGELDQSAFQVAWNEVCRRHEILRASVHQPAAGEPKIIIWKPLSFSVQFEEQSESQNTSFPKTPGTLHSSTLETDLPLDAPPVSRVVVSSSSDHEHTLHWTFHHAFLDGWSTALVLRDVFEIYSSGVTGKPLAVQGPVIRFRDYVSWFQRQETEPANQYWESELNGYPGVPRRFDHLSNSEPEKEVSTTLLPAEVLQLEQALKSQKLTLNTLVTASWALTLSALYGQNDVAFGLTVAGRAAPLEGMDRVVGLFSNVVPCRVSLPPESPIDGWLQSLKKQHFARQSFEHISLDQIESSFRCERGHVLLESLVIVENFPLQFDSGPLRLSEYSSGATSRFPLNLYVIPSGDWQIRCEFDSKQITGALAKALIQHFQQTLLLLAASGPSTIQSLQSRLPQIPSAPSPLEDDPTDEFVAPSTDTEAQLTIIWEQILGTTPIGVNDNFFALGGRSLSAIRLLTRVEETWGQGFSPSILIENPTIFDLAKQISTPDALPNPSLIRFNRVTTGTPLVCVHIGGDTAMYFRHLAGYFPERPVIGLQLESLGGSIPPGSYGDIVDEYLKVLSSIFPNQSVHLVGYCLGAGVALELARQLELGGTPPASFTSIDSATVPMTGEEFVVYFPTGQWTLFGLISFGLFRLRRFFLRPLREAIGNLRLLSTQKIADRRLFWSLRTRKRCLRALRRFKPQPIATSIHLIRSSEFANVPLRDFHLDWAHYTNGAFSSEIIESEHDNLLLEPDVRKLIAPLRARIDIEKSSETNGTTPQPFA